MGVTANRAKGWCTINFLLIHFLNEIYISVCRIQSTMTASSKIQDYYTSMKTAVVRQDPLAMVSLLSLAENMDISIDVEYILRCCNISRLDCSSMFPIQKDQHEEELYSVRTLLVDIRTVVSIFYYFCFFCF